MIHSGAIIAGGISQGRSETLHKNTGVCTEPLLRHCCNGHISVHVSSLRTFDWIMRREISYREEQLPVWLQRLVLQLVVFCLH